MCSRHVEIQRASSRGNDILWLVKLSISLRLMNRTAHTMQQVAATDRIPATHRMKSNQLDFKQHVVGTIFCPRNKV